MARIERFMAPAVTFRMAVLITLTVVFLFAVGYDTHRRKSTYTGPTTVPAAATWLYASKTSKTGLTPPWWLHR